MVPRVLDRLAHTRAKYLLLALLCVLSVFKSADALVSVNPVSSVSIGGSVSLYCNLTSEIISSFSWFRKSYNGSSSVSFNLGTTINTVNLPSRYSLTVTTLNTTHLKSSILIIANITSEDLATFECSVTSRSSSVNLTELIITTVSTTTIDPLTLCYNGSYNVVLYVLIIFTNVALGLALIAIYQFLSDPTNFQLLLLYIVVLVGIMLVVTMIVFWISPDFVNSSSAYAGIWSPIVIVPCGCTSIFILWGTILYFLIFVFKYEKIIELPLLIISIVICFFHVLLVCIILCSVAYCTGSSTLPANATNYSVISDVCAAIILALSLIKIALMLWKFKGNKKIIGVRSASINNIRDHSAISSFFGVKNVLSPTVAKMEEAKNKKDETREKDSKKEKEKESKKEKEKDKDKDKKEKEKDKGKIKKKSVDLSDEDSFGSMDFDQNDLRRSTPNAEDVETPSKTVNPLLKDFIKNSNPDADKKEEKEKKDKDKKDKEKKDKEKKEKKDKDKDGDKKDKDVDKKEKDKEKKKDRESKPKKSARINDDDSDDASLVDDNMFSLEPLSEEKGEKTKKSGKGKTKSKD